MKTMEESGYVDGYTDESTGDIGVEIYGRDVIHLNGKVTSKTPLLTTAQDFAGAINELFQSDPGGGDEWTFPEHWLDIPEPAPNQVIVYLEVDEPGYGFPVQFYSHLSDDYFGGGTIDWGDGTVDMVDDSGGTGHGIIAHQYTAAGQYIATITCGTDATGIYAAYLDNLFAGGVSSSSLHQKWVKAIKVGALVETCASSNDSVNGSNYAAFSRYVNIVYLKFIGKPLYCYFGNMRYLKKIEFGAEITKLPIYAFSGCNNLERADFTGKISEIPQYAFQSCNALKSVDLSSAITIGSGAFNSCYQLKSVTTPLLTEIQGIYAFGYCYSLKSFNAPLLTAMGNQSFSNSYSGLKIFEAPMLAEIGQNEFSTCFALEKLVLAEGCNYNGNTFSSCQLLYPKPQ